MGRFSAPDDNHRSNHQADADAAEPMDWTMISDDEHVTNTSHDDDDVMMLARMQLNDNTVVDDNDVGDAACDSACTSRGAMIAYNNNASLHHHASMSENDDVVDRHDAMTENASANHSNSNSNDAALLQMTQHCLQQLQLSNNYNYMHQLQLEDNEQQRHMKRKRNRQIITSILITASIITAVLKVHAPPPPPVLKQNSILNQNLLDQGASVSSLVGESLPFSSTSSSSSNNDVNEPTITHHETWGEYTSHMAQLTSAALLYTTSVFWYAISNSFRYAALDVKDSIVTVMRNCRNGYNAQFSSLSDSITAEGDGNNDSGNRVRRERAACPIRIQAAYNRHALLPRGAACSDNNNIDDEDPRIMEGFSTEESLRQQPRMVSLPSQNIALEVIAQGIDSWGENLVEDAISSVDVLRRMASFMTGMVSGTDSDAAPSSSSSSCEVVQDEFLDNDTNGEGIVVNGKGSNYHEWILPPAKGFLFVGPAGVGKLHVAQRLANWFFAHCNDKSNSNSSDQSYTSKGDADNGNIRAKPILEIIAGDNMAEVEGRGEMSKRGSIIQHIHRRKGLGSVIIIHHIERLGDDGLLSDIVKVLNGNANTIPYAEMNHGNDEKMDEVVCCDGTVFLLTTEIWGTKRIFQMINQNGGPKNLPREALLSSIRWEVDSHLQYWQNLNSRTTIVPFLPFQQNDLLLIVKTWFQELSNKYQAIRWARLDVSSSALEYIVGADQVGYLNLYNDGHLQPTNTDGNESHKIYSKPLLTFSTNGAHALYQNALYTALKSKLKSKDTRRRPCNVAFLDMDQDTLDYCLSWCDPAHAVLNECETHWRLPSSFS